MVHYDIVGSLPLELLINVVERLDVADIVRSQRVSKRWRKILSCDTIIAHILRETLDFLDLHSGGVSIDVAMADAMRYFRWRHGLEHARPVKKIFLPWSKYFSGVPSKIQYHSRRLCYTTTPFSGVVKVVNILGTEETSITTGPGILHHLSLSDRYLVLVWRVSHTFDGFFALTAWDTMHTIQRLDQRIPALNFHYTIVENKVVIAPQFQRKSSPVYVWDLSSNKIKEIGSFRYLIFCHMDTADNVLVTFEIRGTELLLPPDVQQTKWTTTTGHLLERKVFPLPRPADSLSAYQVDWCSNPWDHWNSWDTWDTFNTFGHRTVAQSKSFWHGNYSGPVYLEYDHAIDRLTIRRIDCTKLVNKFGRYHSAYLTRNLVYRCCSETMELVVHNTATDTATFHSISEQFEREALVRRGNILDFIHVFGDREVFGFAVKTGVHLWFFNPNFAPDLTTTG